MSVAEATVLAANARDARPLRLAEYDPLAARAALAALTRRLERYSPLVGLEESECPECLLLDVTGLGPLFQGEERLVELVAADFREHGGSDCRI